MSEEYQRDETEITTIRIHKSTVKLLEKLKLTRRDPLEDVIKRLLGLN